MITIKMLEEISACSDGKDWFDEHFPNGASWQELVDALLEDEKQEWASWFACFCPASVECSTWVARLALMRDDIDRARLGWYCPADVAGSTLDARLALMRNDTDRVVLGWHCPVGVAGATWSARLSLMCDDEDRELLYECCPYGVKGDPRKETE